MMVVSWGALLVMSAVCLGVGLALGVIRWDRSYSGEQRCYGYVHCDH